MNVHLHPRDGSLTFFKSEEYEEAFDFEEFLEVYAPIFKLVPPEEISAETNAPIIKFKHLYWVYPYPLDPLVELRDTGRLVFQQLTT